MDDLISRQQAIDTVLECYDNGEFFDGYEYALKNLPSAQPEIVRCGECKYAHLTYNKEVKYCDFWETEDPIYMSADNFCSNAERREVNNESN